MSKLHKLGDPAWSSAYGDVKVRWSDFNIVFDCTCGTDGLHLSDDKNETTCPSCGRRYWLGVYFKTAAPEAIDEDKGRVAEMLKGIDPDIFERIPALFEAAGLSTSSGGVSAEGAAWAAELQCSCIGQGGIHPHAPHCPASPEYWKAKGFL